MSTSKFWCFSLLSSRVSCDANTMIFRGLFILGIFLSTLPSLSEALPLTVTPSVASPGQTVTVKGSGFQPGVKGLVWGGGGYYLGSVDTPGGGRDVDYADGYVYVADTVGLHVIDASDPAAPVIIGSVDIPNAQGVSIDNGYAYVADSVGLKVIDISNLSKPAIVGSVNTPGPAQGVMFSNGYAYVADGASGLQVVDVSKPLAPVIVGGVDTPDVARGVSVNNSYAYVADNESGLQVIDIRNPSVPAIIGSIDTPHFASAVTHLDGYAYVADRYSLQVIDISSPSTPEIVGSVKTGGITEGVSVASGYAYVSDYIPGITVVDIHNPSAPTIQNRLASYGSDDVIVVNNYAYSVNWDSGNLTVHDVRNPKISLIMGSVDIPDGNPDKWELSAANGYIYLVDVDNNKDGQLFVVDARNTFSPKIISSMEMWYPSDISVNDNYAYVTTAGYLKVIDISNPLSPLIAGSVYIPDALDNIAIENNFAYATGYYGFYVIDIRNPQTPFVVGSIDVTGWSTHDITSANSYVYVANRDGLHVIDARTPSSPVIVSHVGYSLSASDNSMSYANNHVYLNHMNGLDVIDVTNPNSPTVVQKLYDYLMMWISGVTATNDFVYIDRNGLALYDASNPASIAYLSGTILNAARKVEVENEHAYVIDYREDKLHIISAAVASPTTWLDANTLKLQVPTHLPSGIYDVTILNPDGTRYKANNALEIKGEKKLVCFPYTPKNKMLMICW